MDKNIKRLVYAITAVFALSLLYVGCGQTPLDEPDIQSLNLQPSTFRKNEPREFITATISVTNFSTPLGDKVNKGDTYVFIESPNGERQATTVSPSSCPDVSSGEDVIQFPDDSTIVIKCIDSNWVTQLEPGTYDVGAQVQTDSEKSNQKSLTTVTLSDEQLG